MTVSAVPIIMRLLVDTFFLKTMTRPTSLSELLSRISDGSGHRSECLIPIDDDWKERMRALAQNAESEGGAPPSPDED